MTVMFVAFFMQLILVIDEVYMLVMESSGIEISKKVKYFFVVMSAPLGSAVLFYILCIYVDTPFFFKWFL